jgi:two-component system, LytTR family, response regulator AgrA
LEILEEILKKILQVKELIHLLKIVLCENNLQYASFLKNIIHSYFSSNPQQGSLIFSCSSCEEFQSFTSENYANVFFLDIHLNSNKTGLQLAEDIRQKDEKAYIVFISQHIQNVFDSFKVKAFDFIPKPVTQEVLQDLLRRIHIDYMKKQSAAIKDALTIKIGPKIHHLVKEEIYFIEKESNKCVFHSQDSSVYCYETLETIMKKLNSSDFIRIHRSFIVNKKYIHEIDFKALEVVLQNKQKCFIGGKYKELLMNFATPKT